MQSPCKSSVFLTLAYRYCFRPLHERGGGWFWWGVHGSGPFKQLWDILYNRKAGYHGLHNMARLKKKSNLVGNILTYK
jgi:hypothetical protein